MSFICTKCKIKNPAGCSRNDCPIYTKGSMPKRVSLLSKQEFFGKSPNIFVGKQGYPDVNVGFLSTESYEEHDNPLLWSKENYSIDNIVKLRTGLVNSNFRSNIKSFDDRLSAMGQEIGMSEKPVDVEISLTKKPEPYINFGNEAMPHGPNVKLKNARITENARIPKVVDRAVSDIGLKATDALKELYKKKIDEHYLTRLLSIGTLGVKQQRKMVPTRWSITAVDDTLSKQLISEVKDFKTSDYCVYFGGHLGNYYIVILFPEVWSYELFETYVGESPMNPDGTVNTMTDYESYDGRTTYASETVGGYYAARLGLLEYLKGQKKQASALLLRFITSEYYTPLGVWVVREAVRKTFVNKPVEFDSKDLMINYVKAICKKRFNFDADLLLKRSKLMNEMKNQKKLSFY